MSMYQSCYSYQCRGEVTSISVSCQKEEKLHNKDDIRYRASEEYMISHASPSSYRLLFDLIRMMDMRVKGTLRSHSKASKMGFQNPINANEHVEQLTSDGNDNKTLVLTTENCDSIVAPAEIPADMPTDGRQEMEEDLKTEL